MVSMRRSKPLASLALLLLCGVVRASAQEAGKAPAVLSDISISFKRDPRVLGSTYGGVSWLSPPTFTSAAQPGMVGTVDVKVRGVDARGKLVEIVPQWTAADPDKVTVTPGPKDEFTITVKGPGESKLRVASQGVSKDLVVTGRSLNNAILVEISQGPASKRARPAAPPAKPAGTDASPKVAALPDQKAKNSYAVGVEMGVKLRGTALDLDAELVSRGMKDGLTGNDTLLDVAELNAAVAALRLDYRMKTQEARTQLADKNKKDGEAFLAANKTSDGVVALESGLQYKILKEGSGAKPTSEDAVVCHYRGTLIGGQEFDSSLKRDKPASFPLKRVIKGWSEALQLMPVGSKWALYVPPNLAYGERGSRGRIGPNATLIFEVELLSIRERTQAQGAAAAAKPVAAVPTAPPSR
jgi:FKBP-type peptidyl-prolyl cis-trans isomerase